MKHLSHRWVTEMRCACCGVQAGTVLGAGVCERFAPDPKPAPLPHEWATYEVPGIEKGFQCVHCELETLDPFSVQGTCDRTAPNEEEKQKRIAANLRAAFKDYSSSPPAAIIGAYDKRAEEQELERQSKRIFDALMKPAEKAEALPELPDKLRRYWNTHDARSLGGPHHDCLLLAECRKIAREELRKAQIENRYLGLPWMNSTLLRIVPGKEGEK